MVKYEGRSGKEADLEQFSEAINIIRYPQFNTQEPTNRIHFYCSLNYFFSNQTTPPGHSAPNGNGSG